MAVPVRLCRNSLGRDLRTATRPLRNGRGLRDASSLILSAAESETDAPTIVGPDTYDRNESKPPTLQVRPSAGRYWAVEIADSQALFDAAQRTDDLGGDAFFATWRNGLFNPQPQSEYRPSAQAWAALRHADRLFYRVVTTYSPDAWSSAATSFSPHAAASRPSSS